MEITVETLHKIAHLARLEIQPSEEAGLVKSMQDVLGWMERLSEIDTSDIEPLTHMTPEVNVFREDKAINRLTREEALSVAPKKNNSYFRVPKVIE